MAGRREVPVDPGAGPVQRFASELRKLRAETGITYRAMAQQAGYSITTLSQAAAGEQLPTLPVVLAYAAACGGNDGEWETRWREASVEAAALTAENGTETTDPPYRGLARYETGDSGQFFGRKQLTEDLMSLLRRERFAAVFGPSGSGKSSVLRAGVIPALQHSEDGSARLAAIRVLTPGEHPFRTQAHLVTPKDASADTLVVVDQFEEVFTLCKDPAERAAFIDLLLAARRPGSRLRVLIAVRADFYGRCAEHRDLADALRDTSVLVGPMTPDELREAVVKPAAARGLTVERALTARLVDEVAGQPGGLPLMSHVLLETWRRRRGGKLTLEGYQAAGGLNGAVAQTAEDVYTRLTPQQAEMARSILLRLVTPGDGTPETRRLVPRSELDTAHDPQQAGQIIEDLARARLLTLDDDTVDLAHEALLTGWPRLHGWIEDARDRLRLHRRLTDDATAWAETNQDPSALYRGNRLAAAEEQLTALNLNTVEQSFLAAGVATRDREEGAAVRATRRLRTLSASLSVLLVLAVVAGLIAWDQSRSSDRQRQAADTARKVALSRQLAAQSAVLVGTNSDLASLLAVHAFRNSPTSQALESLQAAAAVPLRHKLTGHSGAVLSVAFSPDGRTLAATADGGGTVRLWDTATGRLRKSLTGLTGAVLSVVFSPDGQTLATASTDDRSVRLWDTNTGRLRRSFDERTNGTMSVAFSPDGRTLATASSGHGVDLWNPDTGRLLRSLDERSIGAELVAFSPDGRTLTTASGLDRSVRLWDTDTGIIRRSLSEGANGTLTVAFSPDGHTLATGGQDQTVRLWDTATGGTVATLAGHANSVQAVAFSPDGRTLATGSQDRTVRLWETSSQTRVILTKPPGMVFSVAFSPDGRTMATATSGVDLWDTTNNHIRHRISERPGDVFSVEFGPDGRTLTTLSSERGVELWDADTGRPDKGLSGNTSDVISAEFSPDGRTIATRGVERGVELWNADTGRVRRKLPEPSDGIGSLAFSPSGHVLATGGPDHTVRLWDTDTGRLRKRLPGHTGLVFSVAFSPDGRTLATASVDGTVRLWDTVTGRLHKSLPGPTSPVFSVAFSPDGRTLATAGNDDRSVRLWDTDNGIILATLSGHTGVVLSAAFTPDGRTLATGSEDQTVRLWSVALPAPTTAISKICRAVGRELTAQERSVYLPDQPPRPICRSLR